MLRSRNQPLLFTLFLLGAAYGICRAPLLPLDFCHSGPKFTIVHPPEQCIRKKSDETAKPDHFENQLLNTKKSATAMGSNCTGGFLRKVGAPGLPETANTLLSLLDGSFIVGGSSGNASMLSLLTPDGEIVWSRLFDMTPSNDFVREMLLDGDGMLLVSGRDQINDETTNYLFRYDYQNDVMLWQHRLTEPAYSRIEGMMERNPGGNYLVFGMTAPANPDNAILEIDRNTGNIIWQKNFHLGDTDLFLSGSVHADGIYLAGVQRSGGIDKIRASISKLDASGNRLWTRLYFNNLNQTARTYLYDHLVENDTIVAYGRGDLNASSFNEVTLQLMKTNLDGKVHWAKSYKIAGSNNEFSQSLISLPDGYILQGSHTGINGTNGLFFIRVDKQGEVIWSRSLASVEGDWSKQVILHDGFLYFAARTSLYDPAASDIVFGKISLDGNISCDNCSLLTDIQVVVNNISNPYDGLITLTETTTPVTLSVYNAATLSAGLSAGDISGCSCTSFVGDELTVSFDNRPACPYVLDGEIKACVNGGFPPYNFQWSTGHTGSTLSGVDAGTYSLTITDAAGNTLVSQVVLEGVKKPKVIGQVTNATCYGANDGILTVTEYDPALLFSFFGSPFSSQTVYENISLGNWQLFVLDTFGCIWEEFFAVEQPDPIVLQLPDDVTIELGTSLLISSNASEDGLAYSWVPSEWLNCSDCPAPLAQPEKTTLYTLTVTSPDGCLARESIRITVVFTGGVYVPTAFSPNGDGINDYFYLYGKGISAVKLLHIFDRWGEKVFENANFPANEPGPGWDGAFRGKPLQPGIFTFYAIAAMLDGSERVLQGDLLLMR